MHLLHRLGALLFALSLALPLLPATAATAAAETAAPAPANLDPGGLCSTAKDGTKRPLVLEHTSVQARIAGNLSRVTVTQVFSNPFKQPLEAVYTFPLPDQAAVDDMRLVIGKRVILGHVKEREEARKQYNQAVAQGKTAALLDQERENVFTQRVANILPGEKISVTIAYSDALRYEGGDYQFVFPLVVAPRYIPAHMSRQAAAKVVPPHVPLRTRSGRDVDLSLRIEAGVPISNITSATHKLVVSGTPDAREVKLAASDTLPNRDFVLHYQVAKAQTTPAILTERDERGGHFAVSLIPALKVHEDEVVPKDVVFLMDTSGSQDGAPIVQSQALMHRMIEGLNGDDTFSIVDFANAATRLSERPLANTAANRAKALAYVDALKANGGTELYNGIKTVLAYPPATQGRLRNIVLLTDGLIGDDERVVGTVKQLLPPGERLFAFGVGSGTNRYLLERIAQAGRGTCTVLDPRADARPIAEHFYKQINDPLLTDIEVQWLGAGAAPQLFPNPARDLFAAEPLVLYGRKADARPGTLVITGHAAHGKPYRLDLPVTFDAAGNPAIAQLWGRSNLQQAMLNMAGGETPAGKQEATETALAYKLMSKYTSFVAVSAEQRTQTAAPLTQVVPQEPVAGLSAMAYGDPHIVTTHGLKFDWSLEGDFVGLRSRAGDLQLHTRVGKGILDPLHTFNVALALKVDGVNLVYEARTHLLTLDGRPLKLAVGETRALPGGLKVTALVRGWDVVSSRGDHIRLKPVGDHLDFEVEPAATRPLGDITGALGSFDADTRKEDDLRDRRGKVVKPPTGPKSEASFLEGWRVRPGEQLLPNEAP